MKNSNRNKTTPKIFFNSLLGYTKKRHSPGSNWNKNLEMKILNKHKKPKAKLIGLSSGKYQDINYIRVHNPVCFSFCKFEYQSHWVETKVKWAILTESKLAGKIHIGYLYGYQGQAYLQVKFFSKLTCRGWSSRCTFDLIYLWLVMKTDAKIKSYLGCRNHICSIKCNA